MCFFLRGEWNLVDDVEDLFLVFVCVSMILHEQLLEGWVCFFFFPGGGVEFGWCWCW